MATPISVGDIIAISTLLFKTYNRCKDASRELRELSNLLNSAYLNLESVRHAVEPVFSSLPYTHQVNLANSLFGIRAIATDISNDLGMYDFYRGSGMSMTKLKFAILQNPRDAESRLTARLTSLNTCMSAIHLDSFTKSKLSAKSLQNVTAELKMTSLETRNSPSTKLVTVSAEESVIPKQSPEIVHWLASTDDMGNIDTRGYFDYAATCKMPQNLHISIMECALRIAAPNRIYGTIRDATGHATLEGTFDGADNTVKLTKKYYEMVRTNESPPTWDYVGKFTPCGIAGEWHSPGDPPAKAHWRGSFGIWLQNDEYAKGEELQSQMKLLREKGRVLTRSMTGFTVR